MKSFALPLLLSFTASSFAWSANSTPPSVAPTVANFSIPSQSVLLTFSGPWNGVDSFNDHSIAHPPMPPTYQPLLGSSPGTQPVDGGNLGIKIRWINACVSNHGFNQRIYDHTGDNGGAHHELGGGVLFNTEPFGMIF